MSTAAELGIAAWALSLAFFAGATWRTVAALVRRVERIEDLIITAGVIHEKEKRTWAS